MARGHVTGRRLALLTPLLVALVVGVGAARAPAVQVEEQPDRVESGASLWRRDCATCHRADGGGSARGPDIRDTGAGGVDFEISTGRMPLEAPDDPVMRNQPPYDEEQIAALVAYARETLEGPDVPEVEEVGADLGRGGELFRLNCASCHQSAGAGGALAYGQYAPDLSKATRTQVVEAMRLGPQQMPVFGQEAFDDQEAADVAAYVDAIAPAEDRGGWGIWHYGPVPEGLMAFVLGIGAILVGARWLGSSR